MIGPSFGPAEWRAIAPFAAVIVSAIGVLLYETFSGDAKNAETSLWFSILGIATALLASLMFWDRGSEAFGGRWLSTESRCSRTSSAVSRPS